MTFKWKYFVYCTKMLRYKMNYTIIVKLRNPTDISFVLDYSLPNWEKRNQLFKKLSLQIGPSANRTHFAYRIIKIVTLILLLLETKSYSRPHDYWTSSKTINRWAPNEFCCDEENVNCTFVTFLAQCMCY